MRNTRIRTTVTALAAALTVAVASGPIAPAAEAGSPSKATAHGHSGKRHVRHRRHRRVRHPQTERRAPSSATVNSLPTAPSGGSNLAPSGGSNVAPSGDGTGGSGESARIVRPGTDRLPVEPVQGTGTVTAARPSAFPADGSGATEATCGLWSGQLAEDSGAIEAAEENNDVQQYKDAVASLDQDKADALDAGCVVID